MWTYVILLGCYAVLLVSSPIGPKNMPITVDQDLMSEKTVKVKSTLNLPSNATSIRADIKDSFNCENRPYGYYADVENDCQIFHVCLPVKYPDGRENTFRWSFICPEETIFSQESFTCIRESEMTTGCEESAIFYKLNNNFGMSTDNSYQASNIDSDITSSIVKKPEPEERPYFSIKPNYTSEIKATTQAKIELPRTTTERYIQTTTKRKFFHRLPEYRPKIQLPNRKYSSSGKYPNLNDKQNTNISPNNNKNLEGSINQKKPAQILKADIKHITKPVYIEESLQKIPVPEIEKESDSTLFSVNIVPLYTRRDDDLLNKRTEFKEINSDSDEKGETSTHENVSKTEMNQSESLVNDIKGIPIFEKSEGEINKESSETMLNNNSNKNTDKYIDKELIFEKNDTKNTPFDTEATGTEIQSSYPPNSAENNFKMRNQDESFQQESRETQNMENSEKKDEYKPNQHKKVSESDVGHEMLIPVHVVIDPIETNIKEEIKIVEPKDKFIENDVSLKIPIDTDMAEQEYTKFSKGNSDLETKKTSESETNNPNLQEYSEGKIIILTTEPNEKIIEAFLPTDPSPNAEVVKKDNIYEQLNEDVSIALIKKLEELVKESIAEEKELEENQKLLDPIQSYTLLGEDIHQSSPNILADNEPSKITIEDRNIENLKENLHENIETHLINDEFLAAIEPDNEFNKGFVDENSTTKNVQNQIESKKLETSLNEGNLPSSEIYSESRSFKNDGTLVLKKEKELSEENSKMGTARSSMRKPSRHFLFRADAS